MKKTIILFSFSALFTGCLNFNVNQAYKNEGAYDDSVKLAKIKKDEKEVVFIPMHHLGTIFFYEDVKKKIDSLKRVGFYFFTEEISVSIRDTITVRKAIKLTGVPFSSDNSGYKHYFDSLYKGKVKLKRELINQPKCLQLGLDSLNSRTVDVTFKEMVGYYEKKYGEIKLQPCDFKKSFYEKPDCKDKSIDKKIHDEVYLDFRNKNVVESVLKDKHKKIAIIYGSDHFKGINKELLKIGFNKVNQKKIK